MVGYEGTWYRKNLGQGMAPKIGNGLKKMAMEENVVLEKRRGQIDPTS